MNRFVKSCLALSCAVIVSACGQTSSDTTGDVIEPSATKSQRVDITTLPNTPLLEWLSNSTAQPITGPRIINFWASWCTPCREEMPLLQESFTSKEIVGINSSDAGHSSFAHNAAQAVLDDTHVSYPIYIDQDDQLMRALGISAFPVTLVIDDVGSIVKRIDGPITDQDVDSLRAALAGSN